MYHKVKNTLAGLSMVLAFIVGGVALGEPVQPRQAAPQEFHATPATAETAVAIALLQVAVAVAASEAVQAADGADELAKRAGQLSRARAAKLRLELGMPYYSFGAMLPRRGES
jgi:hypothetical protein